MKRMTQLDGVRGAAIILLLIWHNFSCQIRPEFRSFTAYVYRAVNLSWSGVDLFFVLSGFLIAGILLDHRSASNYFKTFYLRRICRIFPLYFVMLAVFLCFLATGPSSFHWLFDRSMPIWSYATFTQNIFMGIRGNFGANWLGITWSLAVEEQFYLLIPLLVYFLSRRALMAVLVAAVMMAPLLRWASPGFHAFVNTPWRADSLLSGACLAVLVRWHPFILAIQRWRGALNSLFILFVAGAAVMTWRLSIFGPFSHSWLAGLYSIFILKVFIWPHSFLGQLMRARTLVWCGQVSYGLYLFHQAVSGLLHGLLRHQSPQIHTVSDALITLLALCITLIVAAASYRYLESPILRFGHRYQYLPKQQEKALSDS